MKFIFFGLGNVGWEYNNTRHNIGFEVVNQLADHYNGVWQTSRYADRAEIKVKGKTIILIKPSTFMNLSGNAVRYWMQEEKVSIENILVITDDLALPFGKIRLRPKGSDGGHNGLKHIQYILQSDGYPRLRFGVGNQFAKGKQVDYVLGQWSEEELKDIFNHLKKAEEACLNFTFMGIERAMNFANTQST
jgi:PTH1 family peptidyl-tRNA hydrolase